MLSLLLETTSLSNADDMQFRWGTLAVQPDSRHPRYRGSYTSTGGGSYMSNSLMDYMSGGPDGGYVLVLAKFMLTHVLCSTTSRQVSPTPGIDAPC